MFTELYSFLPALQAVLAQLAPRFNVNIVDLDLGAYDQIAASINLKINQGGQVGNACIKLSSAVGLSTETIAAYLIGAAVSDARRGR
jgi:hypothetical protein